MMLTIIFLPVPYNSVQPVPITSLFPLFNLLDHCEATSQMFTVDAEEFASIITSLDTNRATSCDELSVRLKKECPLAMPGC